MCTESHSNRLAKRLFQQPARNGRYPMREFETSPSQSPPATARSNCPQCAADLVILRVIPGKSGSEYWTLRCIGCGGDYLTIRKSSLPPPLTQRPPSPWIGRAAPTRGVG